MSTISNLDMGRINLFIKTYQNNMVVISEFSYVEYLHMIKEQMEMVNEMKGSNKEEKLKNAKKIMKQMKKELKEKLSEFRNKRKRFFQDNVLLRL